jgi:chromosome segregation ATPase
MPHSACSYCGCHKWEWLNAYYDNLRTCTQLEDTVKDQARDLESLESAVYRLRANLNRQDIQNNTQSWDIRNLKASKATLKKKIKDKSAITEDANQALKNELKDQSATMDKSLKSNADLRIILNEAESTVSAWRTERIQTQQENTALQTEIKELRRKHASLKQNLKQLRIESKAAKYVENRSRRKLITRDDSLEKCHTKIAQEEASNLALMERVTTLEAIEAQLRLNLSSCWQHSFQGWIGRIWKSVMALNFVAQVYRCQWWFKQRLGTVGLVGLNSWSHVDWPRKQ